MIAAAARHRRKPAPRPGRLCATLRPRPCSNLRARRHRGIKAKHPYKTERASLAAALKAFEIHDLGPGAIEAR